LELEGSSDISSHQEKQGAIKGNITGIVDNMSHASSLLVEFLNCVLHNTAINKGHVACLLDLNNIFSLLLEI
jgi:hypothetical protein